MSISFTVDSITINEIQITEKHFLLGILWEGDLEIHTNKDRMLNNPFGERILHGDTVTGILFGNLLQEEPFSKYNCKIEKYQCSYHRPVFLNDVLKGVFKKIRENDKQNTLEFEYRGFNQHSEQVTSGNLLISLKGRKE